MTDHDAATDPRVERTLRAVRDAGVELLYESGPDGINHAAVATAAGVSRTTLYKYWPTRAKLLLDLFACFEHDELIEPTGDLRADLVAMLSEFKASFADAENRRLFVSLLAQSQWDDDVVEARAAVKAIPLAHLAAILDSGARSGEIVAGLDPAVAASRLVGPLMFGALALDDLDPIDVESIVDDWLANVRVN